MANGAEQQPAPVKRPRRRLFQFGLRFLLLFVAVVAVLLGISVHQAKVQADAVARVRALGGFVLYNYKEESLADRPHGIVEPWWRKWIRKYLGVDYAWTVNVASLRSTR